jgi:flagellar hook assembly protein FlgD
MNLVANFITAPSTGTTPDVQPGTVRIVGGLDGYVNTAYENSVSVFFQPRRAGTVYIRVYSLNGRLVREGVVMSAMPGTVSSFSWDLRDNDGTAVSAGVYIVYVKGGGLEIKKKIVVLH